MFVINSNFIAIAVSKNELDNPDKLKKGNLNYEVHLQKLVGYGPSTLVFLSQKF